MKKLVLLLLLVNLIGCTKNTVDTLLPDPTVTDLTVMSQPAWNIESLNSDYTIQFPGMAYQGGITQTIEGPLFTKHRTDQAVSFNGLTSGLGPISYGMALPNPRPASITADNRMLDKSVTFSRNGQIQSVFYFDQQPRNYGQLYLLKDKELRVCMEVSYNADQRAEVLGILQTIQPR